MHNVVYITDEGYYLPTKVSINSVVRNVRDVPLAIHVVAVDLPDDKCKALLAFETANVHIFVHGVPHVSCATERPHDYVSNAALLKARVQHILPDLDFALYVDGDTILNADFMDIFDHDISDVYAAVVMDMCVMRNDNWYKEFGLSRYFNSGIMYLNLRKMREDNVAEAFDLYYGREDVPNIYCEQSALNAAFGEHVLFLGVRYNFFSLYKTRFAEEEVLEFFGAERGDYESPAIFHLVGRTKPWRTPTAPGADVWLQYVLPEDALLVAKNYCDSIRDGLSGELARQAKALAAVETRTEGMRGQFRIQAVLGSNLISESANGVLLTGFEREEKWGRWTTGNASIRVWSDDFLHTGGDLLLYARLRSFHVERRVSFVLNGTVIHEQTVPVESAKVEVKVAKTLLRSDNTLEIRTDAEGISPQELGTGTDTRKLCLGVEYVRFADNVGSALAALGDADRRNQAALAAAMDEANRQNKAALDAFGKANRSNLAAIAELRDEDSRCREELASLKDSGDQNRAAMAALTETVAAMNAELGALKNENAVLSDRLAFLSGNVFIRSFLWISEMKRRIFHFGATRHKGDGT